jgi:hypothetical protein
MHAKEKAIMFLPVTIIQSATKNTIKQNTISITYYSELIQKIYAGQMKESIGNVKAYD